MSSWCMQGLVSKSWQGASIMASRRSADSAARFSEIAFSLTSTWTLSMHMRDLRWAHRQYCACSGKLHCSVDAIIVMLRVVRCCPSVYELTARRARTCDLYCGALCWLQCCRWWPQGSDVCLEDWYDVMHTHHFIQGGHDNPSHLASHATACQPKQQKHLRKTCEVQHSLRYAHSHLAWFDLTWPAALQYVRKMQCSERNQSSFKTSQYLHEWPLFRAAHCQQLHLAFCTPMPQQFTQQLTRKLFGSWHLLPTKAAKASAQKVRGTSIHLAMHSLTWPDLKCNSGSVSKEVQRAEGNQS